MTTQSIEQATGESRSTIKARLKQLTIDRLLLRYGNGRSTWYGLGEESMMEMLGFLQCLGILIKSIDYEHMPVFRYATHS